MATTGPDPLTTEPVSPPRRNFLASDTDDEDTASQRSISLSSPTGSPRQSASLASSKPSDPHIHYDENASNSNRSSQPYTVNTDFGSEREDASLYSHEKGRIESPDTSAAPSLYEHEDKKSISEGADVVGGIVTYPPKSLSMTDTESVASFASGSSRKMRPESVLITPTVGPLILGIALVDFNHLVGPRIEFSEGDIFEDEEVAKILPFLALPDGAHLSSEDYSYFHLVPSGPKPSTIFGISCNRQIAASALLVKDADVTRSTVQKAVVVLASKPVFGPIRDKLGIITQALFNQRDFTSVDILKDFGSSLEASLRSLLTESGLYMGTNLRELVHVFRQRTLMLVKALMLQRKIMFYGHPVERLCTYQYSLISLFPGLLQCLEDCGSPPLNARAPTLSRPVSLRTSDRKSLMAYVGLPLDLFGKDAFFQPYLPLQQLDMIKESKSWLCGSTNTIVTQQKEIDILVNTETGTLEFKNLAIERAVSLTAADRKWMDDIIRDVNEGWDNDDPTRPHSMQFKGSDDYLRSKFDEYISAALATLKYQDFMAKGDGSTIIAGGTGGEATSVGDFNLLWLSEFRRTQVYDVWERVTDPLLFDIVEPRHPYTGKLSVVTDIGLRLSEGIQDLKLEQQLAPAREAVSRTLTTGSTNFFKAVEGVRERWAQRAAAEGTQNQTAEATPAMSPTTSSPPTTSRFSFLSRQSSAGSAAPANSTSPPPPQQAATSATASTLSSWGANISSFWASRAQKQAPNASSPSPPAQNVIAQPPAEKGGVQGVAKPLTDQSSTIAAVPEPTSIQHNPSHANTNRKDLDSDGEGPTGMAL